MSHYENIVAELAERVPEIAAKVQPISWTLVERRQEAALWALTDAEIEALRALQASQPDNPEYQDERESLGSYEAFESHLRPFLIQLLHDSKRHARLREIMDWLEALLGDKDVHVKTLVSIGICEALISAEAADFPALFPFLGARLRAQCRGYMAYFRVTDEIARLLNSPSD